MVGNVKSSRINFFFILIWFLSSTKQKENGATQKENEVSSMLEFFITYLSRSECTIFQQIIGISMETTVLFSLLIFSFTPIM